MVQKKTMAHDMRLGYMKNCFLFQKSFVLLYITFLLLCSATACSAKERGKKGSVEEPRTREVLFFSEPLIPLDDEAKKGAIENPQAQNIIFFAFTDVQRTYLLEQSHKQEGLSVRVELSLGAVWREDSAPYCGGGFLTKNQTEMGVASLLRYPEELEKNVSLVSFKDGAEAQTCKQLSLSLCIPRNCSDAAVPYGFFVCASGAVAVERLSATTAVLGFSSAPSTIPLYAFPSSGGRAQFGSGTFDFTNAQSDLGVQAELFLSLRPISGTFGQENPTAAHISIQYGGESLTVRRSPKQERFTVQTAAFATPYSVLRILSGQQSVYAALMTVHRAEKSFLQQGQPYEPLLTDLGLVFEWPRKNWRCGDYELFRWEAFPEVLFFDFADYTVQNEFFTRLAYFVEKNGYKGTLVSDDFVRTQHGYNAHDYRAESLAHFFTAAENIHFKLNERERLLKEILIHNAIIAPDGAGGYVPIGGAVISLSRQSAASLRHQLMAHESWHGIYFTNADFRYAVRKEYEAFNKDSMTFLKGYWASYPSLQYDTNDEYLMQNEFMAYLLQQDVALTADYFVTRSWWRTVMEEYPAACSYVQWNKGKDFEEACQALSEYAYTHWGLWGGRTSLLLRN